MTLSPKRYRFKGPIALKEIQIQRTYCSKGDIDSKDLSSKGDIDSKDLLLQRDIDSKDLSSEDLEALWIQMLRMYSKVLYKQKLSLYTSCIYKILYIHAVFIDTEALDIQQLFRNILSLYYKQKHHLKYRIYVNSTPQQI